MQRRLITTDCHIAVPFSLIDELPQSYRQYFPHIERGEDGPYLKLRHPRAMMSEEVMAAPPPEGVKVSDDPEFLARMAVRNVCAGGKPSFDPAEQLADLERDGVYGAVLIGRFDGFDEWAPIEADIAYCRVVNDWLAETWGPYLDRVAPGIHLPYRDVAASVKELERAAKLGLRPALLPDAIFHRPYHLQEWEPLWEAANDLRIPFTMHVGGLRSPPGAASAAYPGGAEVSWYNLCGAMGETMGWFTYSGIFERYPNLHIVMTEGYAGWLAFAMEFFDHHWQQSRFRTLGIGADVMQPKIKDPPSTFLKRQAHATFMWDPVAVRNRDLTGLDCLMWGNDYPHNEGSFPDSQDWIERQFAGAPEADIDAIVRGNAARLFRINV
jgi:predicted TIM-barrel fold metal-dependent hydrolase